MKSPAKIRHREEECRGPEMGSVCVCVCARVRSVVSDCDALDCGPPGSSVRGMLQVRILEWVAMPFSGGSS